MKTITRYLVEALASFSVTTDDLYFDRYEEYSDNRYGYSVLIKTSAISYSKVALLYGTLVQIMSQFSDSLIINVDTNLSRSGSNYKIDIKYRLHPRIRASLLPDASNISVFVNLCVDTNNLLIEYFYCTDNIPYYETFLLSTSAKSLVAFDNNYYTIDFHRSKVVTDEFFTYINPKSDIRQFVLVEVQPR